MSDCKGEEFIESIKIYINYWLTQKDLDEKGKLEGLSFSILCMLDGVSGTFDGNSESLSNVDFMLHEAFHEK